jgi:alpha-glucosidase
VRRRGRRWFVAIANGPTARAVDVPLSFLGRGRHEALLVRDVAEDPAAVRVERARLARGASLRAELRAGGGFLARVG